MEIIESNCLICGLPAGYGYRGLPRKYCSRKCRGRAVGINGTLRIRNPPSEKMCPYCGGGFKTYHRHHRFCSRSCSDKGYKHRGGRKDHNHDFIVEQFKAKGFLVHDTHLIGYGFPDLIIQKNGITKLIEIKNPKWHKQYGLTKWQK